MSGGLNKEVAEISPETEKLLIDTLLPRTLMKGTPGMRSAGDAFLPQEPLENNSTYGNRLKRSVLFNGYRRAIHALAGRPFSKRIKFSDDTPAPIVDWGENIDLAGRTMHAFARDVFIDGLVAGRSHVLVDMQRSESPPLTLQDERDSGLRPYWVHIAPERVLGWRWESVDGVPVLMQVRIHEEAMVPDGKWGTKHVERIRVLFPGGFELYEKVDEDEWPLVDSGETSLQQVPFVTFWANRVGFADSDPSLEDLAYINLAHWQSQSDQRNILHVARVPLLFGTGFPDAAEGGNDVEISTQRAIFATDPAATLGYVEHTGAAIGAGRQDLRDLEEQMAMLALEPLLSRSGNPTATARALDSAEAHSALRSMTMAMEDALEEAIFFSAKLAGLSETGRVAMNMDFGLSLRDSADLEILFQMRLNGELTRKTMWEELRRRDVLSRMFDPEAELLQLEEEEEEIDENEENLPIPPQFEQEPAPEVTPEPTEDQEGDAGE